MGSSLDYAVHEPSSVQAHLALANFFVHEGRRDDAAAAFEATLALDPRNASTNRYLALHALTSLLSRTNGPS